MSKMDLSIHLNNSILDRSMNQSAMKDTSILMADEISMVREKEDHSIIMGQSRVERGEQQEDYSILMGMNEDISPIHPQV